MPSESAAAPPERTPGPRAVEPPAKPAGSYKDALRTAANLPPKEEPKQTVPPKTDDTPTDQTPPANGDKKPDAATATPPDKTADGKNGAPKGNKVMWDQLKAHTKRADEAEAKLRQFETQRVPAEEREQLTSRMAGLQKRADDLETEIRFVNYEKSTEFQDKFHTPYARGLELAMHDLKRIPITDVVTGQQRAATEADLFELMNLDPVKQIEAAEAMFGEKLANRAIAHADKVRDLLINRNQALEEARQKGKEREQTNQTRTQAQEVQLRKSVEGYMKAAEDEWNKDPDAPAFGEIKPPEGKELTPEEVAHNEVVKRGAELVTWMGKNVRQAKTPEEAAEIIRKQMAIVKRAQSFGPLRRLYNKLKTEHATMKKRIDAIDKTTPGTGGGRQAAAPGAGSKQSALKKGWLGEYAGR
jgi:hypothetical protein